MSNAFLKSYMVSASSPRWSPPRSDDWRESRLLVCQNYQRSKCRRFLIFGPGRSERTTNGRNLLPHPSRRFAERCLDTLVEVTLAKPGDRKVQTLACFRKGFAKEFAFCRMNQGV